MTSTIFESHLSLQHLALIGPFGWMEVTALLIIGVLIFGKRLPEVGRNFGKSIVEFKKGVKGIHDEIDAESSRPTADEPAKLTGEAENRVDLTTPVEEEMSVRHDEANS